MKEQQTKVSMLAVKRCYIIVLRMKTMLLQKSANCELNETEPIIHLCQ